MALTILPQLLDRLRPRFYGDPHYISFAIFLTGSLLLCFIYIKSFSFVSFLKSCVSNLERSYEAHYLLVDEREIHPFASVMPTS